MFPGADPARPYGVEGPEIEWKERLPRAERLARIMASFANGLGGTLWVGIRDDGLVVGVGKPEDVAHELRRVARELLIGEASVEVARYSIGVRTLVFARVEAAEVRPVLAPGRDGTPMAFVRDGASTRIAARALVRAWKQAHSPRRLDIRERRILTEILAQSRFDLPGSKLPEVARSGRMGLRAARRALVELERQGLVSDRGQGRYGLTPEGHRRAQRFAG